MRLFVLFILVVFASEKTENGLECTERIGENSIVVKIEEDEYAKVKKKSKYIGVSYNKNRSKWKVQRRSRNRNTIVFNGYYGDEETAAHASDTLARKLLDNGQQKLKLNFPDDYIKVYPEQEKLSSNFIGVTYHKRDSNWRVQRWSKNENKAVSNGSYEDEETAAHASDTLARELMDNGEQKVELNFPDDHTQVYPKQKQTNSKYIGVNYNRKTSKWYVRRWCKNENKKVSNGCNYTNEETAAHASDTLARKLMTNGEQKHKLNFPDDYTEQNHKKKRKRSADLDLEHPQNN